MPAPRARRTKSSVTRDLKTRMMGLPDGYPLLTVSLAQTAARPHRRSAPPRPVPDHAQTPALLPPVNVLASSAGPSPNHQQFCNHWAKTASGLPAPTIRTLITLRNSLPADSRPQNQDTTRILIIPVPGGIMYGVGTPRSSCHHLRSGHGADHSEQPSLVGDRRTRPSLRDRSPPRV